MDIGEVRLLSGRENAAMRATEAMLRALGGASIILRLPAPASAASIPQELGIDPPATDDVELFPVIVRDLGKHAGRHRFELLIAAKTLQALVESRGESFCTSLLNAAAGFVREGKLLILADVRAVWFAGAECLLRVIVLE
ncbi:MAG TPA: hypothetical protein VEG30_01125 [Terriglobales bacterium]|nr:hypothetical protein [Terriglobales bacterium]